MVQFLVLSIEKVQPGYPYTFPLIVCPFWKSLWKRGLNSFDWNYFLKKLVSPFQEFFEQSDMVGWLYHLPLNQYQYQTFQTNAQRHGKKLFTFLVSAETKKMFLKIMAMVGFGYQPMVLGYVLPWYLKPFPHWLYQLVVHWDHNIKN